jgi:hypothetical protein
MTPKDERPKLARFKEAYLRMAQDARYRPGAPGDGLGNICLSIEEQRDPLRLDREAATYAAEFCAEEDTDKLARCLASGLGGESLALKLLEMAADDIKQVRSARRRNP